MAIKSTNGRVVSNMSKKDIEKLQKLAEIDDRSVSSYLKKLVKEDIEKYEYRTGKTL